MPLFFFREDPLLTGSRDSHLPFRGIEFENDNRIDLELVLCRRFDGDSGLPGRLEVKRPPFLVWNSGDLPPPRGSPSRPGSSSTARTRRDAPAGWPARADRVSHTTPHACRAVSGTVADSVCRSVPESLRSTAPNRKTDASAVPPPPNAASVKPLAQPWPYPAHVWDALGLWRRHSGWPNPGRCDSSPVPSSRAGSHRHATDRAPPTSWPPGRTAAPGYESRSSRSDPVSRWLRRRCSCWRLAPPRRWRQAGSHRESGG